MSVTAFAAHPAQMFATSDRPGTDGDDIAMSEIIDAHLAWMKGEQKLSDRTISDRRYVLLKAHRELPDGLDDVYAADIETFYNNPRWARWTSRTRYSHLAGFYQWAYQTGWMTLDPTASLKPPPCGLSRPKPITDPCEIRLAFDLSPEPWYSCIVLGLGAGLRATEMSLLRREDITPEYVHVRCGKGGKERFIDTCESLWEWAATRPGGLLVRRPDGRAVDGRWLSRRQQAHWRKIGLPSWHLHRLRHAFCTAMWRQPGRDPLVIRDLMGHVSVSTTQIYAQPDRAHYRHAVTAVDALLRELQPARIRLEPAAA
jgi:integrase/recombinase XerC